MEGGRSRLLIASRDLATLRGHYEDVIVALVRAGVQVSIRYANDEGLSAERYRGTLLRRGCAVELSSLARGERGRGDLLAFRLRQLANLLRFAHPDYRGREWLREAKFGKAAPGPRRWAGRLGRLGNRIALLGVRLAASVDRVLPPPQAARAMLAAERPDAVAVVGLVWSPGLVDVLKAAAWERIPSATWVQSWDNLTNKGLLHFTPDRVFVWNDVQRAELARYHGIPERHACVTGAQTFDHWFNGDTPSSRAEFCSQDGLDPERPIILYLASSRQIEPPPADFFLRWLEAIRSSGDPVLEGATVLVRPHPTSLQPWLGLDREHPRLSVSPSVAAAPINSGEYRQRFRDELHHASVAVGLNTSGMIDAAILGKPVCTVELPDVPNRQRGTIHFEYLVSVGGGFVQTATSLEEHVTAIAELVRKDPYERDERSARFVREFIRPHGPDVTPATVFSQEMLRLLQTPSELDLPGPVGRTIGRLIHRSAFVLGAPLEDRPLRRWARRRRKKLMTPLLKRLTTLLKRLRQHRRRWRARLKPIRWFFLVWLRAAVLTRLRKPRRRWRARLKPIRWFFLVWLRAAVRIRLQRLLARRKAVEASNMGVRTERDADAVVAGSPPKMGPSVGGSRLLIASRNLALLRGHYEDVIVALVRAGVQVSVRYVNGKGLSPKSYREIMAGRGCEVDVAPLPREERNPGDRLALRLRQLANMLRFYHPDYQGRDGLREARLDRGVPGPRSWAQRLGGLGSRPAMLAIRLGSSVDRVLPPSEQARALLASGRPDTVAAVDVDRVPEFVDLLKAAAWEHVPTAIWIQSWDNLTSKGLVHFTPDRIFVWNETQRSELARYHKIAKRHVCVTGAQTFDHWFNGDSPSERAEFCSQNGLDRGRPIILYLASSRLAEATPADFFLRWLEALRASGDPALEAATVLVRPHPTNVQSWHSLDVRDPALLVSPSTAEAPINSPEFRRRYRDELHHASVAVGLNTSAMIDAAIFGKPVCTVELPELTKGQRGTVHFEYLMTVAGGFVRTASSVEEHLGMVSELVRRDPYERDERAAHFVQAFVRPHGLDVTPATVFSEEMLRLLESPSELPLPSELGRTIGRLVHRAAPVLGAPLEDKPLRRWLLTRRHALRRWSLTRRKALRRGLRGRRKSLITTVVQHRAQRRPRLKRVRRLFRVRLRAAVRVRLQRLPHQRKAARTSHPQRSDRQL